VTEENIQMSEKSPQMREKNLQGKIALVTGGSRGLGAASARRLAAAGADVAIAYVNSSDKAEAVVGELKSFGVQAACFQADQANRDEIARMVGEVVERFGRIDILVNSAAVFLTGPLGSLSPDDVAYQWAVNVRGVMDTTQEAIAHMPDGGRVVFLSSAAGERSGFPGIGDYAATKAALISYTASWALELAPRNIMVNAVVVGLAQTDMVIPADSDAGKMLLERLPVNRYADPGEVAAVVGFLASPDASYMTGGSIRVDGGWNA
jgi:3-oxoacyl-[acyl-carrier protein] reductase